MDELLRILFSWNFMVLCLGIAGGTFVFRKLLEYAVLNNPRMPGNSQSRFWRELVLPISPVILGGLIGKFSLAYPYPEGLTASAIGRIAFGLSAGLLSGLVYRVITGLLRNKLTQFTAPGVVDPNAPQQENAFIEGIRGTINRTPVDPTSDANPSGLSFPNGSDPPKSE